VEEKTVEYSINLNCYDHNAYINYNDYSALCFPTFGCVKHCCDYNECTSYCSSSINFLSRNLLFQLLLFFSFFFPDSFSKHSSILEFPRDLGDKVPRKSDNFSSEDFFLDLVCLRGEEHFLKVFLVIYLHVF